jgi:nucleotidyltransferase substrate binding protein (TIGR01987 family)
MDIRSKQRFDNFKRAMKRYEEGVFPDMSDLEEEGLIQRFEIAFELAWKCLQDLLQERGYANVRGPKPVIEQAFQDGLISDGPLWMRMLKSRNETTHLYDEATFLKIVLDAKGPFLNILKTFRDTFPQ